MKKRIALVVVFVMVLMLAFTGCGAKSTGPEAMPTGAPQQKPNFNKGDVSLSNGDVIKVEEGQRLIVYTYRIQMTVESVEESAKEIEKIIGGNSWLESQEISDGYANFTFRVETKSIDTLMAGLEEIGKISEKNVSSTDYTNEYQNADQTIKVLEIEEGRLVELLKTANVSETIQINRRLAEIEISLKNLYGELKNYEDLYKYSVVSIRMYQPNNARYTFGDKIVDAFQDGIRSLEDLFLILITITITLLPFVAVGVPLFIVIKKKVKNRKSNKVEKEDKTYFDK